MALQRLGALNTCQTRCPCSTVLGEGPPNIHSGGGTGNSSVSRAHSLWEEAMGPKGKRSTKSPLKSPPLPLWEVIGSVFEHPTKDIDLSGHSQGSFAAPQHSINLAHSSSQ